MKQFFHLSLVLLLGGVVGGVNPLSAAVTPDSAIFIVNPQMVFSQWGYTQPTATFTVTVYDSAGNPVPENTPIAIVTEATVTLYDTLYSDQIFKVDYDPTWENVFYAWTNSQGQVVGQYGSRTRIPKNYIQEVYIRVHKVRFSNPNDPATASKSGNSILDADNSLMPRLVGVSTFSIQVTSRFNGDQYVFESPKMPHIDTTAVTIQFFDAAGQTVPEGAVVNMIIYRPNVWGYLSGDAIVHRDTVPAIPGFPEERHYYFRTDQNGRISFTYLPANTGNVIAYGKPPWHSWYAYWKDNYTSKEEAFEDWKKYRTAAMEVRQGSFWQGQWKKEDILDRTSGDLPILVSSSLLDVSTTGLIFGDRYIFTSPTRVERAQVTIFMYDDLERPVPEGALVYLLNATFTSDASGDCLPFVHGRIYPIEVYSVDYAPNECGDANFWAVVRAARGGKIEFILEPPYAALTYEKPHLGYDDYYLEPAFVYDLDQSWTPFSYTATVSENSELPIFTSAYYAAVAFQPSHLSEGKVFSRARVTINDTRGRPVPPGTSLILSVDEGTIMGTSANYVQTMVSRPGEIMVPYFSPTRSIADQMDAELVVRKPIQDYPSSGYKNPLGFGIITMQGIAFSPADPSVSKLIFGKSFSDILQDLNPLKALGSMKRMAQKAEEVRAARKRLLELAGDSQTSDTELEQAMQEFRQKFGELANTIGNFIQDVPGTTFDPNVSLSAQGTVRDILEKGIRRYYSDQVMNKFVGELVSQVTDFALQKSIEILYNSTNKIIATSSPAQEIPLVHVELTTPLHFLDSKTGVFKAFAFRFQVKGAADSVFNVTDQYAVPLYLFTREMLPDVAPGFPLISPGIMEVVQVVDSQTVEFEVLGVVVAHTGSIVDQVVEQTTTDTTAVVLEWLDGNGVTIPKGALDFTSGVVDSAKLFLLQTVPPNPVREQDSVVIHAAYALGHYTLPDSIIQPLTFNVPATFQIDLTNLTLDSTLLPEQFKPFRYDETAGRWVEVASLPGYDSTIVAFEINGTGIFGVGGKSNAIPVTNIREVHKAVIPQTIQLLQNFPNPFNGNTVIRYRLPAAQVVTLVIYDIQGRQVKTLMHQKQEAGWHAVLWDGKNQQGQRVSSGIYFYQLRAGTFRAMRKMVLVQ